MKHTLKKILAVILAAATLLCCAPLSGLAEIDLPDISGWLTTLKAKAISDTISISVSPSKIGYSLDSEGNVYINGTKNSTFSFDVNFSTESTETIKFYYVITAPEAFSGADLGYINTGRSVSKSSPFSRTVKLSISKPLALKDSKIEIKAYESGALEDDANLIASASIKVEKFAFSDEDLSEIKKSASVQIKPEVKEVKCNNGLIENNEINFTATIYNNIPPQYNIYEDYIKSSSDFDLELSSVSGRKGDYCDKIKVDSVKNVVIKPGESHTINGTVTLDGSPSDISDTLKEFEAKFGIEIEGTCGGKNVWAYNDRIITIENTQYQSPVNGSHSTVDIKWPTNGINLDGLTSLGLSLSECQDIADIVLVELAMFTLPPKSLETKISEKIINRVFKCNAHLGAVANEMKLVFPVTIDGVDMEIDIICSTTQFSWDGTPYGSFSSIKYKAYTLEGLFNKRKYHSEGTAGMFAAANVKDFFTSAHDFAISEISNATSKCFKTEKGFAEIIFRTIPQLILSKKGKGKALENAGIDLYINAIKLTEIDCPVDVFIYDVAGKLCASVENNEVTLESDDFDLRVNGSTKELYLYGNDYKIVTKATANGTMNVTVEEVGYINGTMHKYEMSDVPLSIGKEYTLEISDEMEDPLNYRLISNNGDVIDNQEVTEDKDNYITDKCGDNLKWTFNRNTGRLTISGSGSMYGYNSSSSKSPWYDYRTDIKSISIGDTVTTIGSCAFYNCDSLTSVTIPDSVTNIDYEAFYNCDGLASVIIGNDEITIASSSFFMCNNFTNVYYTGSVSDWLNIGNYSNYKNLMSYAENFYINGNLVTEFVIPNSMTVVSDYIFYGWDCLESVTIPNSITTIGDSAFSNCARLASISIPKSVTTIDQSAFSYCNSLASVSIPDSVTTAGEYVFSNCKNLTSVTIGNGLTTIVRYMFSDCEKLTDITLGNNTAIIDSYAFENCKKLMSISFPGNINTIMDWAFKDCTSLEKVTIGSGITTIDSQAFDGCSSLKIFEVNSDNQYYSSNAEGVLFNKDKTVLVFYPIGKNNISYTVPSSVTTIESYAFESCINLTNLIIPDSVTHINYNAFRYCSNIKELTMPVSAKISGSGSFYGCTAIDKITLTKGTGKMKDYALNQYSSDTLYKETPWYINNNNLKDLVIEDGVTYIGKASFYDSIRTSITLPDSVTAIGARAFENCENLTNITMGNDIICIGEYAFYNTAYYNNDANWKNDALHIKNYLIEAKKTISGTYIITDGTELIANSAFKSCYNLTNVTIPDSVTIIGDNAFYNCSRIKNLTIPASAKITESFYGCSAIEKITLTKGTGTMQNYTSDSSINHPDTYYKDTPWYISGCSTVIIEDGITNIGDFAFYYCEGLAKVTISNSVKTVGDRAFYECTSLTNVTIPDSVTSIGDCAFYNCSGIKELTIPASAKINSSWTFGECTNIEKVTLTKGTGTMDASFVNAPWDNSVCSTIVIEDGITNIINYAFYDCKKLTNVTIPDSVINIGNHAFMGCDGLTNITIGNGVITIGSYAFYSCDSLMSITIPSSVTSIGDNAFRECEKLTRVTIPRSVISIGNSAFEGDYNITDVYYIGDTSDWCKINFANKTSNPMYYGKNFYINEKIVTDFVIPDGVTAISDYMFSGWHFLETITIPNSVTSIGNYAFESCDNLTSITIPDSVTTIGYSAFSHCDSLTNVIIGNGVITIGGDAFESCDNLTSITIGDSVTAIGDSAFVYCHNLTDVYYTGDITEWLSIKLYDGYYSASNPMYYAENFYINGVLVTDLFIPNNITVIPDYAFYGWECIETLTISDGVKTIGDYAFTTCLNLTNATIPDSVTTIGEWSFWRCDSLENITIPNSVTTIGEYAFYDCDSLAGATIGDNVTTIGKNTFADCAKLSTVKIGNSVTSIGDWAFYNCDSLISITIPDRVTTIGENTFSSCAKLSNVSIGSGVTTIGKYTFYNCSKLISIIVDMSNEYYSSDEYGVLFNKDKTYLIQYPVGNSRTSYTIPNSVTTVGDYALAYCNRLKNIIIGTGLSSIGDQSFYSCDNLTSLTVSESNKNYSSDEYGVLFNKDKTDLVLYPMGNTRTNYTVPSTVTTIDRGAFIECSNLDSVIIPDNVITIRENAFRFCYNLKEVTIGKGVATIGEDAFSSCNSLTNVYFVGSEKQWNSISIEVDNEDLTNATIHYNYNPNAHTHSYKLTETIDSTCIDGSKTYVCTECGDSYTEIIPATDKHQKHLAGKWEVVTQPTTESEGKKLIKCERCGTVLLSESIPALSAPSEPIVDADVVKLPTQSTISYGDSILLHVDASKIPEGGRVEWTASNNNFSWSADGDTCKISPKSSGDTTFTATIYDAEGNPVSIDEQTMTSKAGFFDKIIAFFKSLFGLTKTYENVYKGIIR